MKKGFVFDLDGVITDTAKFHYIAWKDLADSIGITIDLKFNERLKGISRMDSLERILVYGGKDAAYTPAEKEALATQKNTHYVELLQALTPADLLPGVKEFLAEAKACQVPCVIASASKNAPFILQVSESAIREIVGRRPAQDVFRDNRAAIAESVRDIVQATLNGYGAGIQITALSIEDAAPPREVTDAFDAIVDPASLHKGKPDPEIFIKAAQAIGLKPEEAVGFEDAQAGIDGIKACDMYAVGVMSNEELHGADVVVKKLTDLSVADLLEK